MLLQGSNFTKTLETRANMNLIKRLHEQLLHRVWRPVEGILSAQKRRIGAGDKCDVGVFVLSNLWPTSKSSACGELVTER